MRIRARHANEHWALKRLGGDFTGRKKWWRCSLDRISKVYLYRHQKIKLKCHLYLSDSCHQNIEKIVTWGLKSQKYYVYFTCNPMGQFISGVRRLNEPIAIARLYPTSSTAYRCAGWSVLYQGGVGHVCLNLNFR